MAMNRMQSHCSERYIGSSTTWHCYCSRGWNRFGKRYGRHRKKSYSLEVELAMIERTTCVRIGLLLGCCNPSHCLDMVSHFWLVVLWLVATSDAVQFNQLPLVGSADEWNLNTSPNPNSTAHLVFNTVSSLLQHWPNTKYHSGLYASIASEASYDYHLKVIPLFLAQFRRAHCCIMGGTILTLRTGLNGWLTISNLRA